MSVAVPWGWAAALGGGYLSLRLALRLLRYLGRESLKDKTVLITGASAGLGAALAKEAGLRGAKLILLARSIDKLQAVAAEVKPAQSVYRYCDLAEEGADFSRLISECLGELGSERLDILVNCAGLSVRASVAETSMAVHRQLMEVNYFGQVAITTAALPWLGRGSTILAISSVQGLIGIPHRSAYAASKHALQAFADSLRAELAEHGIRVCVASPGYIATGISANALTGSGAVHGVTDAHVAGGLSPDYAARAILDAVAEGRKDFVLADAKATAAVALRHLLPGLFHWVMARRAREEPDHKTQ